MSLPKLWTECHEEVSRGGRAEPCNGMVVAIRSDPTDGRALHDPGCWYPVCAKHSRAPMVSLWRAFEWAIGPISATPTASSVSSGDTTP